MPTKCYNISEARASNKKRRVKALALSADGTGSCRSDENRHSSARADEVARFASKSARLPIVVKGGWRGLSCGQGFASRFIGTK